MGTEGEVHLLGPDARKHDTVRIKRLAVHARGEDGVGALREAPREKCLLGDYARVADFHGVSPVLALEYFDELREHGDVVGPLFRTLELLQTCLRSRSPTAPRSTSWTHKPQRAAGSRSGGSGRFPRLRQQRTGTWDTS
jgi:hypothetical protein